jgi:ribosome-associated protein
METIQINSEFIQLNQLLKLLGWAETGSEANDFIDGGLVKVNGEQEFRRRNKIYPDYKVELDGQIVQVVAGESISQEIRSRL